MKLRSMLQRTSLWLLTLALVSFGSAALAEDIATQRFLPHVTTGGYFQTEGTEVRHPVDPFSLGLWLNYGGNPLISVADGDVVRKQVAHALAFDLTASYAFAHWFELGLHVPVAYLKGDDVNTGALGDIRVLPKFRFLDGNKHAVGLALLADVRLPSHTNEFYGGARLPGFAPRLLLDHQFGLSGFRLGLDVGVLIQKATDYQNIDAGAELQAGLGMGYRFNRGQAPVELMFDLRSFVGLQETNAEEVGLEGLLGAGIDVARDWKIKAGGGLGLLEGFGIPTARGFVGVRWEPSPNDPDHDGVRSPEPSERDQAYVVKDEPPAAGDEAAAEAEPASVDDVDDAERAAAIKGGYDACPDLPEDLDGVEDEDGCPEGDTDKDGVLDYLNRCPDEQETINGFQDDDGCEDEGPAQIVIEEGRLTILETIRFEPNSSKLDRRSDKILEQIALTLRKHDEIDRLEIGGHTDSTGPRGLNMRLSRERARSVRQWLLGRGIKPERLSARGYGPDKPIADNNTDSGRTQNRRVEFLLVR
ncbi:MAG: OmpA family protein [Myxococcales bacterium]